MTNNLYMLDTNTVSYIIKNKPTTARENLNKIKIEDVCISSITHAELFFWVERSNNPIPLKRMIDNFLKGVKILPWDLTVSKDYAVFRANAQKNGLALSGLDMLIAAHSINVKAMLVTSDKAFYKFEEELRLIDWC